MNFAYKSLLLLFCTGVLGAMSREDKELFKKQLRSVVTSAKMEELVWGSLQPNQIVKLVINSSLDAEFPVEFKRVTGPGGADAADTRIFESVTDAVEEVFFEEMRPFICTASRTDYDTEAAKFAKYEWANKDVVKGVEGIFEAKVEYDFREVDGTWATEPAYLQHQFKFVKKEIERLTAENHKSSRMSIKVASYVGGAFVVVALLGGIIYYCWTTKSDEHDDEDTQTDQEVDQNDDAQELVVDIQ